MEGFEVQISQKFCILNTSKTLYHKNLNRRFKIFKLQASPMVMAFLGSCFYVTPYCCNTSFPYQ
jgi:hypothetical protein